VSRTLRYLLSITCFTVVSPVVTTASEDLSYQETVQEWRNQVEERLKADEGWLTVAGLFWLPEGKHRFGSAADNDMVLPERAPGHVGTFTHREGKVTVRIEPDVHVTMHGNHIQSAVLERGPKHAISVGDLLFWLHGSGERKVIRMRDPNSKLRKEFTGLKWFPVDETYRVNARFEPYSEPRKVESLNVFGDVIEFMSPGELVFELNGQEHRLQPTSMQNGAFHIIFRDETSGKETYGAARFLNTEPAENEHVELDFNKAHNPPCAYNPFTTCPLPPKGNSLPVRIEAGEKAYQETH
jgi:uncharacterized protein (DUF1684 family)